MVSELYNMILSSAQKNGERKAIVFEDESITYKELIKKVDVIASYISSCTESVDNGIIVAMARSIDMVATMIAIVKTGNYYIPLDMAYPQERINYIITKSKSNTAIADNENIEKMKNLTNVFSIETILQGEKDTSANVKPDDSENMTYCIFTSGSTGNPKGVLIPEKASVNLVKSMQERLPLDQVNTILCATTQCFDLFFFESFACLCSGLTVILTNESDSKNPKRLLELIKNNKVDIIQMTPSRVQMLGAFDKEYTDLQEVKMIIVGGEPLPQSLLTDLREKTNARIFNYYGPTETTVWSSGAEVTTAAINVGKPFPNERYYVLDENHNEVEEGQSGEIAISGFGLAKGYIHDEKLTNERFITYNDETIYLTGDLGRKIDAEDNYEILGRIDNQIKFAGYRIELEEIENVARKMPDLTQCIVAPYMIGDRVDRLILYYVSSRELKFQEFIDYLGSYLPEYMVPNFFARVEKFNYTLNGKVDRKNLPEIEVPTYNPEDQDSEGVSGRINEIIYAISNFVVNEDNKELVLKQVTSLQFVKIMVEIENYFDIEFDDDDSLIADKYNSVEDLYNKVEEMISETV